MITHCVDAKSVESPGCTRVRLAQIRGHYHYHCIYQHHYHHHNIIHSFDVDYLTSHWLVGLTFFSGQLLCYIFLQSVVLVSCFA